MIDTALAGESGSALVTVLDTANIVAIAVPGDHADILFDGWVKETTLCPEVLREVPNLVLLELFVLLAPFPA